MKVIYIIILLSILLLACNKESGTTTVEGTAIDVKTGKPIAFAQILLYENSSGKSGGDHLMGQYESDINGNFSFSFIGGRKRYHLEGYKQDLYLNMTNFEYKLDAGKKNKNVEVKLRPASWLKIHLKDDIPTNETVKINMQNFHNPNSISIIWPPIDTSFTVSTFSPEKEETFYYWLYKDNQNGTRYEFNAECKSLDTTDVYINF